MTHSIVLFIILLAPVIGYCTILPVVIDKIANVKFDGKNFLDLMKTGAFIIPWMSHAGTLAMYDRSTPFYLPKFNSFATRMRYVFQCSFPVLFFQSLVIFAIATWLNFTPYQVFFLISIGLLHAYFGQFLVWNVQQGHWGKWLVCWGCYFSGLLFFPKAWFLPPILGILAASFTKGKEVIRTGDSETWWLINLKSLCFASLLWLDKLALSFLDYKVSDPGLVFIVIFPASIGLNLFYINHSPKLSRLLENIHQNYLNTKVRHFSKLNLVAKNRFLQSFLVTLRVSLILGILLNLIAYILYPSVEFWELSAICLTSIFLTQSYILTLMQRMLHNQNKSAIAVSIYLFLWLFLTAISLMTDHFILANLFSSFTLTCILGFWVFRKWAAPGLRLFVRYAV